MIAKEQLEELQAQIAKDEKLIAELRLKRFVGAGATYSEAKGRIALSRDVLEDLTAQYDAEQTALASRPAKEKAEAKYLDGAARALGKADDRVRAALEAAQTALVEVVEATQARAALVDETAAEMATRGFLLRDEPGAEPHETGTERGLHGPAVRIRGQWWAPLSPLALVDWLQHRVIAARMPRVTIPFCFSCRTLEARTDGVVDTVTALPAVQPPAPPSTPQRPFTGAVSYISSVSEWERRIDDEELRWTTTAVQGEGGDLEWQRKPPSDEAKRRAAHRKQLLHEGLKDGRVVARS